MLPVRALITRQVSLRAPMVLSRSYVPDVRGEGSTATAKGFDKREQAEEGQYIRKRELEKLKAAQDRLKVAQDEVAEQQKRVDKSK